MLITVQLLILTQVKLGNQKFNKRVSVQGNIEEKKSNPAKLNSEELRRFILTLRKMKRNSKELNIGFENYIRV